MNIKHPNEPIDTGLEYQIHEDPKDPGTQMLSDFI